MTENEEIKKVINGLNFLKEKLHNGIYADRLDCIYYAITALKEIQQYREMDKKLREAYGDCDGLLAIAVEGLCKHSGINIGEPIKARLLTDEDVEKWDAYREIGTVEECREAVEKQKPKKRIYPKTALERYYHAPECPNCKRELKPRICGYTLSQAIGIYSYCPWCGQNLEGVEESEGE